MAYNFDEYSSMLDRTSKIKKSAHSISYKTAVCPATAQISLCNLKFKTEPMSSVQRMLEWIATHRLQGNDSDQPAH